MTPEAKLRRLKMLRQRHLRRQRFEAMAQGGIFAAGSNPAEVEPDVQPTDLELEPDDG